MSEVGLTKLEQPDFTASARAGSPALIVVAEQTIPQAYWLPQPPKLDRQGSSASSSEAPRSPEPNSATPSLFLW